ncbi:cytochrome P450 [Sphingobium sufflavum]|uniref:cytochrome P450 n=1 Tax=Sphingobium sufflavum TaxID=1129547 RepID=UPI001F2A73BD|nr:cytochrome P450 [Sphingobium sufflavum]MCE7795569.1 cytochrome P450 [Sphingobium sufflavum]
MSTSQPMPSGPMGHGRDDHKSATLAAQRVTVEPGVRWVRRRVRAGARHPAPSRDGQAGAGAEAIPIDNPDHLSVFFLNGALHRRRRSAIARFFTPKAIATRYRRVMEETTDAPIVEFRRTGQATLDAISFQLAVNVAADIVGLTASNPAAMARRIHATLDSAIVQRGGWVQRLFGPVLSRRHGLRFVVPDVKPAIAARRGAARATGRRHHFPPAGGRLFRQGDPDRMYDLCDSGHGHDARIHHRGGLAPAGEGGSAGGCPARGRGGADGDTGGESAAGADRGAPLSPGGEDGASAADARPFASGDVFALDIRAANVDEAVTGTMPVPDRPGAGGADADDRFLHEFWRRQSPLSGVAGRVAGNRGVRRPAAARAGHRPVPRARRAGARR